MTPFDTDAAALVAIAGGDLKRFDELVDRYKHRVFGFIRRKVADAHRAEDMTQDVFLRLFRAARVGAYDGRSPVAAWLFTIANNRVIDHFRSEQNRPAPPPKPPPPSPHQHAASNEHYARLRRLIGELPPEQRDVVELKLLDGLTFTEIAAHVGCPVATAKSRLAYALKKLQSALNERALELR